MLHLSGPWGFLPWWRLECGLSAGWDGSPGRLLANLATLLFPSRQASRLGSSASKGGKACVRIMYKHTRSVKITCSTHTPGGCSLNFAQPLAGQSFSDMPWRVPGFVLEAWALQGRGPRAVATLWPSMFEP